MVDIAPQCHNMSTAETLNVAVDMSGKLDGAEVMTGTPTITEVTTSNLTLSNKVVSTAELTINGATVAIGKALQFAVSASTTGDYTIDLQCGTDSTPAQTLNARVNLSVC